MRKQLIAAAVILPLASAILAPETFADDAALKADEKCFPAEGLVEFYGKFDKLKPARLDTLETIMTAEFIRDDGAAALPKFWARHGGVDSPFVVGPNGRVTDFHDKIKTLPEDAELCGELRTPDGDEPKIGLSMDGDIVFKNRTGPYSLAELQDGVGDGKSFYKKMFGGPMAMFVPKMTHVTVQYINEDTPLDVSFTQAGSPVASPPYEEFGGTYVIGLEDIEASGADTMTVGGGGFHLIPSPSVKKMKKLGFSEGDED